MAQDSNLLVGRRKVIVSLGALAGITAASGVVAASSLRSVSAAPRLGDEKSLEHAANVEVEVAEDVREPGTLFGLPEGTSIGSWRVEEVHAIQGGAIPVIMSTRSGERFQVDVVRRDAAAGAPLGVANTRHFSVFVANKGDGSVATDESHGCGAIMLGRYLEAREAEIDVPDGLMTLAARNRAYPDGTFLV